MFIILLITSGISFATNETGNETIQSVAQNEEINIKNESERIGEKVESRENGYLNISFEDDYNGYCINKGWKGAGDGDSFTVKNTSAAVNNKNGNEVGNYIKILFVDFHDEVTSNARLAQNVIWSFTDNYFNHNYKDIYYKVIEIAESGRVIADHGETININNTTKATFDFEVLSSGERGYQSFFGYKITYSDIENTVPENSTNKRPSLGSTENNTVKEETQNNTTLNNTNESTGDTNITESDDEINESIASKSSNNTNKTVPDEKTDNVSGETPKIGLSRHVTGIDTSIALVVLAIIGIVLVNRNRKY